MKGISSWVAVGLCLASTSAAWAAKAPEPVRPKPFGWLDFGGEFYAKGQWDSDQRETGSLKTDEQQTLLREGVQIHTRGFAYHPNLLDWRLFMDVAAVQESQVRSGQETRTMGTLTAYDLSGIFLREKFVSVNFTASRSDDLRDRDFGQSIRAIRDRLGGGVNTKGKFPASLQVEHSTRTQQGDTRSTDATTDKAKFKISDRRNVNWLTDLTFEREDTRETSTFQSVAGGAPLTDEFPIMRDELNITNVYKFGSGKEKHLLNGRIRWLDRTGSYVNSLLSAEQALELNHSKTFSTFYSAGYFTEETVGQTQDSISASAGLRKKFFESLEVGLQGNIRDTRYSDGYEKYNRIAASADYTKKTPIGLFTSSLQVSRENDDHGSDSGLFNVRNESVTLTDLTPKQLLRANIVPGSITVTDANDVVPYFEGLDYELQSNGAFTQIVRKLPGTNITSGQTVHVSYAVQVARQSTIATDRVDWLNRLALKKVPVDIYCRYRSRQDTLTGGQDPNNLEDETTIMVGAEFRKAGLRIAVEHERSDRVLSPPSVVNLVRAGYDRPLSRTVNLHLDAHYRRTQYDNAEQFGLGPGQDALDEIGANAQLTARLSRNVLVRLMTEYSEYTGRENHSLFRNSAELEWRQGKLTFTLKARHEMFTQEESTGQGSTVTFNLKREF